MTKKNGLSRMAAILPILAALLILPGCSAEEAYDTAKAYEQKTKEQIQQMQDSPPDGLPGASFADAEDAVDKGLGDMTLLFSRTARKYAPAAIITSLCTGIVLLYISSKTIFKAAKKCAWGLFIIGIPALIILMVYGSGFLYGWFA